MSLVIRLFSLRIEPTTWIWIVAGIVIWDELFMRLDNRLDWHIITNILNPIYRFLKLEAARKFFSLGIPWHERHNSGALVEKVNKGADKVNDILNGMAWEFIPTAIQTILSLIPLSFISPIAAGIAGLVFAGFITQSIHMTRILQPMRNQRYDFYEEEGHQSVEMVQAVETIVMYDQTSHVMTKFKELHDDIIANATEDAQIGIYTYNRRRIRLLSLARRLILVIWIWQLYQGSLDIANLIFINVLVEKLFHSFWRFARLYDRATEAAEGAKRLIDLLEIPTSTVRRIA